MGDLVTVVIPIYKTHQYLRKCVDSVLSQTYRDLEIILVDDGSPDECPAICDEYATKDSRIKVVHKRNGGLSDARNCGIDKASGRYIVFIDSDDYILNTHIEGLYDAMSKNDADMAVCNQVYLEGEKSSFAVKMPQTVIRSRSNSDKDRERAQRKIYNLIRKVNRKSDAIIASILRRMFKVSIIREHDLRFPVGTKIGEDRVFIQRYLPYVYTLAAIKDATYIHVDSDTSVCKKGAAKKDIPTQQMIIDIFLDMYDKSDNAIWRREYLRIIFAYRTTLTTVCPIAKAVRYRALMKSHIPFMLHRTRTLKAKVDVLLMAFSLDIFCRIHSFTHCRKDKKDR